jgi:alkylated DNA repair dioxygenase AlkB
MPEDVFYFEHFLSAEDADRYFRALLDTVAWAHEEIVMYGKRVRMPRLTAWYGDPGAVYVYSGLKNEPIPWNASLLELRARVSGAAGVQFNSVLLNRYRSGGDGMSWHADDEPELGEAPVIASLSLGAPRLFTMRQKEDKQRVLELRLAHGSLLIMRGASQRRFQHAVPKEKRVQGERVNLTFRLVRPQGV